MVMNLTPETQKKWGKMSVDQMMAHLNVAYDLTFFPEKVPDPPPIRMVFVVLHLFAPPRLSMIQSPAV